MNCRWPFVHIFWRSEFFIHSCLCFFFCSNDLCMQHAMYHNQLIFCWFEKLSQGVLGHQKVIVLYTNETNSFQRPRTNDKFTSNETMQQTPTLTGLEVLNNLLRSSVFNETLKHIHTTDSNTFRRYSYSALPTCFMN